MALFLSAHFVRKSRGTSATLHVPRYPSARAQLMGDILLPLYALPFLPVALEDSRWIRPFVLRLLWPLLTSDPLPHLVLRLDCGLPLSMRMRQITAG